MHSIISSHIIFFNIYLLHKSVKFYYQVHLNSGSIYTHLNIQLTMYNSCKNFFNNSSFETTIFEILEPLHGLMNIPSEFYPNTSLFVPQMLSTLLRDKFNLSKSDTGREYDYCDSPAGAHLQIYWDKNIRISNKSQILEE